MTNNGNSEGLKNHRAKLMRKNRSQIMAAATLHFLNHGYDSANMVQIAKDAKVSSATLYKHVGFHGGKARLFWRCAEDQGEGFVRAVAQASIASIPVETEQKEIKATALTAFQPDTATSAEA